MSSRRSKQNEESTPLYEPTRSASRKKSKIVSFFRILLTSILFLSGIATIIVAYLFITKREEPVIIEETAEEYPISIEVIDEDASLGGEMTSRMREYIGQAESDFKDLGYNPIKAVIPTNSIREVDFYLEGYSGYIKMLIDRETAVSVEDADRMLRYLASIEVSDFLYIDVRLDGRAFWK